MKINKFIGKTLSKNEALIAESILGQKDINYLDDVQATDDPEDGWHADYSTSAHILATDVKCFSNIAHSKKGIEFKVSPKKDMVVSVSEFKKLVETNHENLIRALTTLNSHLSSFVTAFDDMKKKGYQTSISERETRQKLFSALCGLENSNALLTSKVSSLSEHLKAVLKVNKSNNIKSTLTADDIRPFIKENKKAIKNL